MEFAEFVELAGRLMEGAGLIAIVGGAAIASAACVPVAVTSGASVAYTRFRQDLGRAILLGLEFLVGGDIIRTVSEMPSLEEAAVLATIVLIRTFLSFTLEVELAGRWPWQRSRESGETP